MRRQRTLWRLKCLAMRRDLLNEASPLNMNGKSSVISGKRATGRGWGHGDRKWLRRAERCATLLCKCHTLRKIRFGPRDRLGTLGGISSHWKRNALVSRCTWHVCFRVTPGHDRTEPLVRHGTDLPDECVFITSEAVIAHHVLSQTTAATIAQSIITVSSQHSRGSC